MKNEGMRARMINLLGKQPEPPEAPEALQAAEAPEAAEPPQAAEPPEHLEPPQAPEATIAQTSPTSAAADTPAAPASSKAPAAVKPAKAPMAVLMLEDGSCFVGTSSGVPGEEIGEISFNTAMIGYPEVISDPANAGQIVMLTYPQVGNYGIARADLESDSLWLKALVTREICPTPSNYRCDISLPDFLAEQGIVGITGIDTRSLTHVLREKGAMQAIVSTVDLNPDSLLQKIHNAPRSEDDNLVAKLSCDKPYLFEMNDQHASWFDPVTEACMKVIAVDLGVTCSSLNDLVRLGCAVIVVPWDTSTADILGYQPDGVVFSTGPGNPSALGATIEAAADLMGRLPILGIGLGHQVLALAAGGEVEKMKNGHRGPNYPVSSLASEKVAISSQNHGYTVRFSSMGIRPPQTADEGEADVLVNQKYGRVQLSETNLNDQTVEGLRYLDVMAVGVEYQPEVAGDSQEMNAYNSFIQLISTYMALEEASSK
ncbi:MAG: glutamine-hydrolyzing carbamoyl-phosphate synthase small subunit [Coriobacteriia bacterium]|nr:glutamine-hydrolyzing carbamoyl-phosphate synthase small subunit [Coriobacteriia bacterium]